VSDPEMPGARIFGISAPGNVLIEQLHEPPARSQALASFANPLGGN
jgi:hypothetical protein